MSLCSLGAHGQRRDKEQEREHEGQSLIKQGGEDLGLKEMMG